MNTSDYITEYYQNYDEDAHLHVQNGLPEFLTTIHYIEKYAISSARILEIGAGTGRYSHALAQAGYIVDAVELVAHNIEIFKRNTRAGERVTIRQGNAVDLAAFPDETYDITLLLGPMYHLFEREDQYAALSEALCVTKTGGTVFAAYCMSDATILSDGFVRGHLREIIDKCMLDTETFDTFSRPWDVFE